MRKLIVTEFYTLDGMMSDPQDRMDWVLNNFNAEMGNYENEIYDDADVLLLGRVTFKIFEGYWPHVTKNSVMREGDSEMAPKINGIHKIVFSKSMAGTTWENSQVLKEIDANEIAAMKRQPGKNMIVVGSANIVRQLTDLGLVDELHLLLQPVVLGNGKPLFKNIRQRRNFRLLATRDFGNGVMLLKYQPVG